MTDNRLYGDRNSVARVLAAAFSAGSGKTFHAVVLLSSYNPTDPWGPV